MPTKAPRTPRYCLQESTGRAYVRVGGQCFTLGRYGVEVADALCGEAFVQRHIDFILPCGFPGHDDVPVAASVTANANTEGERRRGKRIMPS